MKKILLCIGLMALMAVAAFGQDNKIVRKIQIRHADPQLIFLLLAGQTNFNTPPEMSTMIFSGFGGNGGFGGSGFGGGSFGGGSFGGGSFGGFGGGSFGGSSFGGFGFGGRGSSSGGQGGSGGR
jgi:hypothetical protein